MAQANYDDPRGDPPILDSVGGLGKAWPVPISGLDVERRCEAIWHVTLNSPETRNALSTPILVELAEVLQEAEARHVHCMVIGGAPEYFASGADLRELAGTSPLELYRGRRSAAWDVIHRSRTPLVARVAGLALGGGFELALACDVIVASDGARFGLPETTLGLLPGAGGTQRLTRAAAKP